MKVSHASPRFVAVLGLVLAAFVIRSGVGCHYPQDWWLENTLVFLGVLYLALTFRSVPLSRASYVLILCFLGLHEVGAHTTFSEVPYDDWTRAAFGVSVNDLMGWERNHYDRLVHFSYGLMLALPMKETLDRWLGLRGFASPFVAWVFILATSSAYELVEWAAALAFGGGLGIAFLGTQGDVWDGHKDTALAILGAALALAFHALLARRAASR